MNKQLAKVWVGFTLIFIVAELTYINGKSLNYLSGGLGVVDGVFAIIGSIAFSMVTVLIMMLSKRQWLKYVFPIFDAALVFCGFNLQYDEDIMANPIRFYLSIFLAVFTGIITYSLGQINAEQYINDESESNQIESNRIIFDLKEKLAESNRMVEEFKSNQIESKRINDDLKKIISELLPGHIQWENFLGQKRKEKNGYESKIEGLARKVKSGEKITYETFKKEVTNA